MRKELLVSGEIYHIFTRSIADYRIYNNNDEFGRMRQLVKYYQFENDLRFSYFIKLKLVEREGLNNAIRIVSKGKDDTIQIIAYCLMPTHIHLIIKQLTKNGISEFMANILNSYTRYFNTIHKRKGPLWESRFKSVLVKTDDQLLHLTRYIHLNPVTAKLINKPQDWPYSSYGEYIDKVDDNTSVCRFDDILEIKPSLYRKFVNDQISYQRELAKIKKLIVD